MDQAQLEKFVEEAASRLEVPGVAVGVYADGQEQYAFQGVTSIENPLPVDASTLFQFGSTGKTFTATAMMRLVDQGRVDLNEKVRTYVPELKLKDESVAREVTVLQLFNHTAGWQGDFFADTGQGDDALAKFVEKMADLEQVAPLGSAVSYNNASLCLAGRIIEKVTGQTFEQVIKESLLDPLGLKDTFYFSWEIMSRRYTIGHEQRPDGKIKVLRKAYESRSAHPAGGNVTATAADQIAWARFHLGDGRAADGTRVLSEELLRQMQQPTAESPGSAIGDAVGISWLLRDVEGVRLVEHGGTTNGQLSEFQLVPERDFAVITMTNCTPSGRQFNDEVVKWALEAYLGIVDKDPEPLSPTDEELAPFTGSYETIAVKVDITAEDGRLILNVEPKPETIRQLREEGEEVPEQPPIPIGLLPGEGDLHIVTDGPAKGMKGYFVRGKSGEIEGIHVGGRLATKTGTKK